MRKSINKHVAILLIPVLISCFVACNPVEPKNRAESSSEIRSETGDESMSNDSTEQSKAVGSVQGSSGAAEESKKPRKSESNTSSAAIPDQSDKYKMKIVAERQTVDIIRQDSDCNRRLVYLKFSNYEGVTYKDCTFTYIDGGNTVKRCIATIYLNNKVVYDTIWVSSSSKRIKGTFSDSGGEIIWEGTLIIEPAPRQHTIAKTKVYSLPEIKPMTLRGINYYPRYTPWTSWTTQEASTWESEFKEMAKLNINSIRTFAGCRPVEQKLGNCAIPEYLETISKLFAVADKNGIKVLFCMYTAKPFQLQAENFRYVRSIVEPFINDGRILGWDLINEIDSKGLSVEDYVDEFCLTIYPKLSELDPNHINCIGFGYTLDNVLKTGLTFNGKNQFWQFHYYRKANADHLATLDTRYFKGRPFIIGECGDTSMEGVSDAPRPDTGEDWQLEVYQSICAAAMGLKDKGYSILGIFPWTAFEFPTMANNVTGQDKYGLIRPNGQLKPAGEYLKGEYAKLKAANPAQWD